MKLTGPQREQLFLALTSAFPDRGALARMVNFELEENLEVIAGGATLADTVFNLVGWAKANERIEDLIRGAREQNPGNSELRAFEEQLRSVPVQSRQIPPAHVPAAPVEPSSDAFHLLDSGTSGSNKKLPSTLTDVEAVTDWYLALRASAQTICRLELPVSMASAFLLGPSVAITCYHVIQSIIEGYDYQDPVSGKRIRQVAQNVKLRFGYKLNSNGELEQGQVYQLAPNWLIDSSPFGELDYALLRVEGAPGEDRVPYPDGEVRRRWLSPVTFDGTRHDKGMLMMLHSMAGPLKVGYATLTKHNDALRAHDGHSFVDLSADTRIAFRTDVQPGSSGAPCFTTKWELIGMCELGEPASKKGFGINMGVIAAQPKVKAALGT